MVVKSSDLINRKRKSCGCEKRVILNFTSLVGQKFNKLLVTEYIGKKGKFRNWMCLCDCGNKTQAITGQLKFGSKKSCGCIVKECQVINLVNQRFGSFIVLERVYKDVNKKQRGFWKCLCDCGEIRICSISQLKSKKLNCCEKCRNYYGENNGNWNPKITNEERFFDRRNDPKYREWRKQVYSRDRYACKITGITGDICAHHLESWSRNKKLRYSLQNGITILQSIHRDFHKKHGLKTTKKDFKEFVENLTEENINNYKNNEKTR